MSKALINGKLTEVDSNISTKGNTLVIDGVTFRCVGSYKSTETGERVPAFITANRPTPARNMRGTCTRCDGTGQFGSYGTCFRCSGSGRL
jgi:hypothetical protein